MEQIGHMTVIQRGSFPDAMFYGFTLELVGYGITF